MGVRLQQMDHFERVRQSQPFGYSNQELVQRLRQDWETAHSHSSSREGGQAKTVVDQMNSLSLGGTDLPQANTVVDHMKSLSFGCQSRVMADQPGSEPTLLRVDL